MFWLFRLMRLSKRGHREPEAENNGDRQHEIHQPLQERNKFYEPLSARAREEHIRQQAVAGDDDQNNADDGLCNFRPAPFLTKDEIADETGDDGRDELREYGEGERGALAGAEQPRLNKLFKRLNVFLKFTCKKFAT